MSDSGTPLRPRPPQNPRPGRWATDRHWHRVVTVTSHSVRLLGRPAARAPGHAGPVGGGPAAVHHRDRQRQVTSLGPVTATQSRTRLTMALSLSPALSDKAGISVTSPQMLRQRLSCYVWSGLAFRPGRRVLSGPEAESFQARKQRAFRPGSRELSGPEAESRSFGRTEDHCLARSIESPGRSGPGLGSGESIGCGLN